MNSKDFFETLKFFFFLADAQQDDQQQGKKETTTGAACAPYAVTLETVAHIDTDDTDAPRRRFVVSVDIEAQDAQQAQRDAVEVFGRAFCLYDMEPPKIRVETAGKQEPTN